MKTVNVTQVKQCLGELLGIVLQELIAIQKHQKDFAVILLSERLRINACMTWPL
jgi:hypothetical protein